MLETLRAPLTRDQELRVARAAAAAGVTARAIRGFQLAATTAAAPLAPSDRMAYAGALARGGRRPEALRLYEQLERDGGGLAGAAAYQRARVLLQSGQGAAARSALRAVASRYANVENASAPALMLLADLQVDDGDLAGAARSLAELTRRHPKAEQAPLARFRGALLAFGAAPQRAAAMFDSLVALYPDDAEALPARYWAARALDRAGQARRRHGAVARDLDGGVPARTTPWPARSGSAARWDCRQPATTSRRASRPWTRPRSASACCDCSAWTSRQGSRSRRCSSAATAPPRRRRRSRRR